MLRGRFIAATSITPGVASRRDIAPTLSLFGPEITKQVINFQQYRIKKIHVKWVNLSNVSTATQNLIYMYKVPLTTDAIPAPSEAAFLAFKNCRYHSYRRDDNTAFAPFVKMGP